MKKNQNLDQKSKIEDQKSKIGDQKNDFISLEIAKNEYNEVDEKDLNEYIELKNEIEMNKKVVVDIEPQIIKKKKQNLPYNVKRFLNIKDDTSEESNYNYSNVGLGIAGISALFLFNKLF